MDLGSHSKSSPSYNNHSNHKRSSTGGSLSALMSAGGVSPSTSAAGAVNRHWTGNGGGGGSRIFSNASIQSRQSIVDDLRPTILDPSALSSEEFDIYPIWLETIKPARSGEPDRYEEQDALRFLREECGIEVHDEINIMSMFERFPLGLLPGHFFALLRLASWVQQGESPSKTLLFTQTNPPRIKTKNDELIQSADISTSSIIDRMNSETITQNFQRNVRSVPPPVGLNEHRALTSTSTGLHQHHQQQQRSSSLQAPLVPVSEVELIQPIRSNDQPLPPPPVPDDSHKPAAVAASANPFRGTNQTPHLITPHISLAPPPASSMPPMGGGAIMGFDPAPNPFRQSKPKLVKPTPIVADASTQVLGRPSAAGAADPFRSGQSVSSRSPSISGHSLVNVTGDLKPPPLPPRHISPLIQAGLNARFQVRKQQESLPPKTFTVLQSTQSRHPAEKPRLLNGQTAPPPTLPGKRRSITETRISGSSLTGGQGDASTARAQEHIPDRRVGPLPAPIAPKPSYGGKGKNGVPAWLQEQEELQKISAHEHHNEPNTPLRDGNSRSTSHSKRRHKKRTTSEAQRIQFLDDESESSGNEESGTLSEQARSAASIDRNNPFFQHGRDVERSVDLEKTLGKLAVENAVAKAEHDSRMSVKASSESSTTRAGDGMEKRPLGRSKTTRDSSISGKASGMLPPAVPPRKRNEAFPATFNSGTYPGFGRSVRTEGPTMGGLRQIPKSKKAEVGIPAHVLAERERMERERLMERSSTAPLPQDLSSSSGSNTSISTNVPPPPPMRRRTNSIGQKSGSDDNIPISPQELELLSSKEHGFDNTWLAQMAARTKLAGQTTKDSNSPFDDDQNDDGDDDEPEVDEQYLLEQRQQHQRQWQQRGNTIDVIREEESSPPASGNKQSPVTNNTTTHPSLSQRRATENLGGGRRTMSGIGGLAGLVRRSSMLARGSFGADDVVSSDTDGEEENDDRTPRIEKAAFVEG